MIESSPPSYCSLSLVIKTLHGSFATNGLKLDAKVEALIEERNEARKAKDWAKADEIRDKLKAMNIVLKDTPMGVKWSRTDV